MNADTPTPAHAPRLGSGPAPITAATPPPYRGRLAPSPTGYLHLGHARTFWIAQARARQHGGTLILRNEDLDRARCKPQFVEAMIEDLRWFGFVWQEGPDVGGPFGPYQQSERTPLYRAAFDALRDRGFLYPCACSRKDVQAAATAPHAADDEPLYPGTCRPRLPPPSPEAPASSPQSPSPNPHLPPRVSWRFRVPDGEPLAFTDLGCGSQRFVAGQHFGDFVVWRPDDLPAYQLAVVVDDAAMRVSEVVRGADLLLSTARQLLLYRALQLPPPDFYHCPLVTDEAGQRLAKRHDALSLRALRAQGTDPADLRRQPPFAPLNLA